MKLYRPAILLICATIVAPGFGGTTALAESARTQTVALHKGWNAVYLEVDPSDSAPEAVFGGTPIDVAAAYYAPSGMAQFMTDPGADLFAQAGWSVWYASSRADAFLTSLYAIYGPQAYLIHATTDYEWKVKGAVALLAIQWQPNSFNLVGFSVDPVAGPTFAQFFAGSKAHQHNRIYRLAEDAWRRVSDPSAETMRDGEAFWIYCDGGSQYQGPLRVETTTSQGVLLDAVPDSLVLRNETDHPITATVEHVPGGGSAVPLSILVQTVSGNSGLVQSVPVPLPNGGWTQALPPLEAHASLRVPLAARLRDFTSAVQGSLLKVSTDLGTEVWVPVIGLRRDLTDK